MFEEFPYHIRLPIITKQPDKNYDCNMVLNAYMFTVMWLQELGDRRNRMRCDHRLVSAAQKHAEFLSSRTPEQEKLSMHIGRNGSYANERARAEGYKLPDYYDNDANNIESCYRGGTKPENVLHGFLNSPPHYNHIMGQGWFEDHIVYGVGYSVNDWVVLIAPVE